MGALVVADPHEPLEYDEEAVLLLDDWTDGVGDSPDEVLAKLRANGMSSMSGMDMGSMDMGGRMSGMGVSRRRHPLGRDTGDVRYPLHLINGRSPKDPASIRVKPGTRLRLRLINGGSDTAYRVAVGGHRLTVVSSDGYPVEPVEVDTLILGMGERYDVLITAGSGVFPIVAQPEGKPDSPALAVLRTTGGGVRNPEVVELRGRLLSYADLHPTAPVALPPRQPDRTLEVGLRMQAGGRRWVINGKPYEDYQPVSVQQGERVRLRITNQTMMFHPMHLHGHTFALVSAGQAGVRKDTINVLPMQQLEVDLAADNPGQWLLHCHNAYHGELGMMTVVSYIR
jgi:FtsP/CotA-like multicopper oxidase with cupredoxin domain